MNKNLILATLLLIGALVLAGCQVAPVQTTENTTPTDSNMVNEPVDVMTDTAPVMTETDTSSLSGVVVEATEGDLVQLKPEAIDPDNDVVVYFFTKPFDTKGKWQTREGDAGKYSVTVTASDGKLNTSEEITVLIKKAKKAPVIECPSNVNVKEGDLINLNCNIYDPEGDKAVVEYSGFMKGPTYQTDYNDAGTYTTVVKAKNQYKESSQTVKIVIENTNRDPTLSFVGMDDVIQATEGDIITLNPSASDPDGDKVTVTYSDPFDSNGVWKTKIGDAGTHTATVVASDGKLTVKKSVTIKVAMKNTAPKLKTISDITVFEGETINLPIDVTDREGDNVKVTVSGWMTSQTYTTNYNDAGKYSVTVTVSDGEYDASQTFKVTVVDRNRPPVFKVPA